MIKVFKNSVLYRLVLVLFLLGSIYYGVKLFDLGIDRFVMHQRILNNGAMKITKSHFRPPEGDIFHKGNLSLFLDNVTQHKSGIFAWKPFYLGLLGLYSIGCCLVVLKVICGNNGATSES